MGATLEEAFNTSDALVFLMGTSFQRACSKLYKLCTTIIRLERSFHFNWVATQFSGGQCHLTTI